MNLNPVMLYLVCFIFTCGIPIVKGAIPGTFFWRPRIDITLKTDDLPVKAQKTVLLIDASNFAVSLVALTKGIETAKHFKYQNPLSAYYNTNLYRWALRYITGVPEWMSTQKGHYLNTHKVWKNRYEHMNTFVPSWLRPLFFFVHEDEWKDVEKVHRRYRKYAESAFTSGYVYALPDSQQNASISSSSTSHSYSF